MTDVDLYNFLILYHYGEAELNYVNPTGCAIEDLGVFGYEEALKVTTQKLISLQIILAYNKTLGFTDFKNTDTTRKFYDFIISSKVIPEDHIQRLTNTAIQQLSERRKP